MKRPLLDRTDRIILIRISDSLYAQCLKVYLAKKHLCREISRDPIYKWTVKQLEKLNNYLTK